MKSSLIIILGLLAHSSALSCALLSVGQVGNEDERVRLSLISQSKECPIGQKRVLTTRVECWTIDMPAYKLAHYYGVAYGTLPVFTKDKWVVPFSGSPEDSAMTGKQLFISSQGKQSFVQFEDELTDLELLEDSGYENPAQLDLDHVYQQAKMSGKNKIGSCLNMSKSLNTSLGSCAVYVQFGEQYIQGTGVVFTFSDLANPPALRRKSFLYMGYTDCGSEIRRLDNKNDVLDLSEYWVVPN